MILNHITKTIGNNWFLIQINTDKNNTRKITNTSNTKFCQIGSTLKNHNLEFYY